MTDLKLIYSDSAAAVSVNGLEELAKPADLLRRQAASHDQEGGLLQLGHASKLHPHSFSQYSFGLVLPARVSRSCS